MHDVHYDQAILGTKVRLKGSRYFGDEYEVQSYNYRHLIEYGDYVDEITYKVTSKRGETFKVDHEEIIPPYDVVDRGIDDLLKEWRDYNDLYAAFGDNEYLNKRTELEIKMKLQTTNRRG